MERMKIIQAMATVIAIQQQQQQRMQSQIRIKYRMPNIFSIQPKIYVLAGIVRPVIINGLLALV